MSDKERIERLEHRVQFLEYTVNRILDECNRLVGILLDKTGGADDEDNRCG